MTIVEMLEKRAGIVAQARQLVDKADAEKRAMTAEDKQAFDQAIAEANTIKEEVDRRSRLDDAEKSLADAQPRQTVTERADKGERSDKRTDPEMETIELRAGMDGSPRSVTIPKDLEYRQAWRRYLCTGNAAGLEQRALQADKDTAGGYTSPAAFMATLIQALDNDLFMRRICNVLPPLGQATSLGAPSLDADPADPTWTSEILIGSEDSTMAFGKRELTPHACAQYLKISKKLLRVSTIDVEALVRQRLAFKLGAVLENAYMNGSGAGQPLGIFTASNDGITTTQDVSTGNAATAFTADGLMNCLMDMPAQYRRNCSWIFHREAVTMLMQLKGGDGNYMDRYIYTPALLVGQPDSLFGKPVYESEYAPHAFTASQYVGVVGNFSQYWIVDSLSATIQVLLELYAATNQNGYISRVETDGMPVLAAAFRRVKLST